MAAGKKKKEESSSSSSSSGSSSSSSSSSSSDGSSASGSPPPPSRPAAGKTRGGEGGSRRREEASRHRSTSPETKKRRKLSSSPARHRSRREAEPVGRRDREREREQDRDRGRERDGTRRRERDRDRKDVGRSREKDRHENGRGGFADRAPQEEAEVPRSRRSNRFGQDSSDQEGNPNRNTEMLPPPPPPPKAAAINGPPSSKEVWGKGEDKPKEEVEVAPDFGLSGKLAEESNKVNGVVMVYNEPPEARKPTLHWRLYCFKNGEPLGNPLYIHRQSCYYIGRERRIADIATDHPSCSKQHAVLQYRATTTENPDGTQSTGVRPYLMDLGSTNGSFINNERVEPQRFYELMEKDMLRFGNSTREYVMLHENSAA